MKQQIRSAWMVVVLLLALAVPARAQSTPQDQARQLAREGLQLYQKGEYRGAIDRFMAADKLAPAALNDFNVALCYDKLNDREQALRYYRSYLNRAPTGPQRDQAQASINRIEGEMREASRKAEEARRADEAARKAADEEAARKAAEEAGRKAPPPDTGERQPPITTGTVDDKGSIQPTGDPELDRVAAVDIEKARTERNLYGAPAAGTGPATGGAEAAPPPPGSEAPPMGDQQPKKSKPAYKQWWFWVVVGVSAVILIDIATTDDRNAASGSASAPVLFRF